MFMLFSKLMQFSDFNISDFNNKQIIIGAAIVIGILLVGGGGYFYYQSQKGVFGTQNPPQGSPEEARKLVEEVGKLMELPPGEVPTAATVTDVTKLQDQPFFARAKNGDKVLIYQNAQKAILYDPVAKKIIEVAPINVGSPSAQVASPSASPTQ